MIKDKNSTTVLPRSGRIAVALILVTLALNTSFAFCISSLRSAVPISTGVLGLLFLFALILRDPMAIHITILAFLSATWAFIWPSFWPFYLLGPLVSYGTIVAAIPYLRKTTSWLRVGIFDKAVWWLVGLTVLISSFALLLWVVVWYPDLSTWLKVIPNWSPILLILGGLGFALLNAAIEESIYRGILLQVLDAALGIGNLSVILQSIAFGLIHIHGIPNGWVGVGMATIYGLMLGIVRRRAKGMLAPFVAHVFADIVIFTILVLYR